MPKPDDYRKRKADLAMSGTIKKSKVEVDFCAFFLVLLFLSYFSFRTLSSPSCSSCQSHHVPPPQHAPPSRLVICREIRARQKIPHKFTLEEVRDRFICRFTCASDAILVVFPFFRHHRLNVRFVLALVQWAGFPS